MADNTPPRPWLEGIKSGSLEGMQFHGHSQMKVMSDFCPPEPRENELLSEGIKRVSQQPRGHYTEADYYLLECQNQK